jgi:hypothetical protein
MNKPTPDLSVAAEGTRRRRLYKKDAPREVWLVRQFRSPTVAFLVLFGLATLSLVPYIILHLSVKPTPFTPKDAVQIAGDGTFKPQFHEAKLERFFSRLQIVEIEKRISDKTMALSTAAVEQRRDILLPVIHLVETSLTSLGPPAWLRKDATKITDEELKRVNLTALSTFLTNNLQNISPENRQLATSVVTQVDYLNRTEEQLRQELRSEILGLEPPLSFCWLYVDCGWWAFEVILWSFLGVIANTVIALILACRKKEYSPAEFVLVFPKVFLAPLLAFIIVALWGTGLSESKINYLNLPYFLVFSFLLGFGTEALYEKLRDLVAVIVTPAAKLSEARLEEAGRKLPYAYQSPNVQPADLPAAKSLDQLEKDMSAVIKARLERAIVANTAINK